MAGFQITPLVCPNPDCGRPLAGLPYDRMFTCISCASAYAVKDGAMRRFPIAFADIRRDIEGRRVYLPVWRFGVHVQADKPDQTDRHLRAEVGRIDTVWVTAYLMQRPDCHGDLGMILSQHRVRLPRAAAPPPGVVISGITRGPGEAIRHGELFVTAMIDKATDVTGMDIRIQADTMELWALPFAVQDDFIVDLASKVRFPRNAIEDLDAILSLGGG